MNKQAVFTAMKNAPASLMSDITNMSDSEFISAINKEAKPPEPPPVVETKIVNTAQPQAASATTELPNQPPMSNTSTQQLKLGELLSPEFCAKMVDTVVPSLLVILFRLTMDLKISRTKLQATKDELDTLAPVCKRALDTIMLNMNNPWVAMGVAVGVIYSSKAAMVGTDEYFAREDKYEKGEIVRPEKKPRKGRSDAGKKREKKDAVQESLQTTSFND